MNPRNRLRGCGWCFEPHLFRTLLSLDRMIDFILGPSEQLLYQSVILVIVANELRSLYSLSHQHNNWYLVNSNERWRVSLVGSRSVHGFPLVLYTMGKYGYRNIPICVNQQKYHSGDPPIEPKKVVQEKYVCCHIL